MERGGMAVWPVVVALAVVGALEAWRRRRLIAPGLKRLALQGSSHMVDEYDARYARPARPQDASPARWTVKALHIHPIKSCAAVELDSAAVDRAGFVWDRKFAFAELLTPHTRLGAAEADKKPRWTFRTQRQVGFEKLAHVRPELWFPARPAGQPSAGADNGGLMIVRYPRPATTGPWAPLVQGLVAMGVMAGERSFQVPLTPPKGHRYPAEQVSIWKDSPTWLNYGIHVPDDFRRYLGVAHPLTLFRVDPASYREVYRCAPRKETLGYQPVVGFQDAYPVHLLNLASVRDVGERVKQALPRFSARRFRSNILVAGPAAYDEDEWKQIRVGRHRFVCACHTVRCRLPNVDPDTAERHAVEPDKTLKSFRCIDDGDPLNACLGLQLVPQESAPFQIRVGDEIEVLERGEHHYIKQ